MKQLIFIRHAKSDWSNEGLKDIERPLNARGLKDAPIMTERLLKLVPKIDHFVSSPANRTKITSEYFMKGYGALSGSLEIRDDLYEAHIDDIIETIRSFDFSGDVVAVFGHNPGLTFMANLANDELIDNVPTCGIFLISAPISSWRKFDPSKAVMEILISPK